MANKNNRLQKIFGNDHNAPIVDIGLTESPIATASGLIYSGIGDNPTRETQRTPRTKVDIKELIESNPEVYPVLSSLMKYGGTEETKHNAEFTNQDFKSGLKSCGHTAGAPYCNYTAALGAKEGGDNDFLSILKGSSTGTYADASRDSRFNVSESIPQSGEFIGLSRADRADPDQKGKTHSHTYAGLYDKAGNNVYTIEGNSTGFNPMNPFSPVEEGVVGRMVKAATKQGKADFVSKKKKRDEGVAQK